MYENLDRALQDGCVVRAFRSGGGVRVVRVERDENLVGYGEHPHIEEALELADRSYLDPKFDGDYYLTGSPEPSSKLDAHLLRGRKFRAVYQRGDFQGQGPHVVMLRLICMDMRTCKPVDYPFFGETLERVLQQIEEPLNTNNDQFSAGDLVRAKCLCGCNTIGEGRITSIYKKLITVHTESPHTIITEEPFLEIIQRLPIGAE